MPKRAGTWNLSPFCLAARRACPVSRKYLPYALEQTDAHHSRPEQRYRTSKVRLPRSAGKLHIAQRREDIGQRAGTGGTNELEHRAQVAGDQTNTHRAEDQGRREYQVPGKVERFSREVIGLHDLPANKRLQREGGEHVQSETETCDVHHHVVRGEVIEDVALGLIAER